MKCQTCNGEGGWERDTGGTEPWGDSVQFWVGCTDCNGTGDDGCEEKYQISTNVMELVNLHHKINGTMTSEKKLNLLSLALLRQAWRALELPDSRELLRRAELIIEGEMSGEKFVSFKRGLKRPKLSQGFDSTVWEWTRGGGAFPMLQTLCDRIPPHPGQSVLFRDIFHSPFNQEFREIQSEDMQVWLAWEYGLIPRLAEDTYNNREEDYLFCNCGLTPGKEHPQCPEPKMEVGWGRLDRQRLKVLSDALEECGCRFTSILEHLRQDTPHVRGCWVIDLLLGRT